jgi:hypothetical protein
METTAGRAFSTRSAKLEGAPKGIVTPPEAALA